MGDVQGANYPRRKLSGCNYLGAIFLGENCPGGNCLGGGWSVGVIVWGELF